MEPCGSETTSYQIANENQEETLSIAAFHTLQETKKGTMPFSKHIIPSNSIQIRLPAPFN